MPKQAMNKTEPGGSSISAPLIAPGSGFGEHPVINSNIKLPTPSIRAAFDIVGNTALQRAPGCCFFAYPRFGKSSAIEVLVHQLAQSFPLMPSYVVSAKGHNRFSELIFLGELLTGYTHMLAGAGKVEPRWGRLLNLFWTDAQSRRSDRAMLFVDEAQNWYESEFTMLRDLSNELSLQHGIQLIVVSFGAPQIVDVRSAFIHSGRTDLIGRFMIQQYEFFGIKSLEELRVLMACYDDVDVSEYPEGSGRSYTDFLMSHAFRSGWRLEHESGRLWQQFKRAAQQSGGLSQVGMQWVANSIREFLVGQIEYDHPGFKGSDEDWERAVLVSGFKSSLGVTSSA